MGLYVANSFLSGAVDQIFQEDNGIRESDVSAGRMRHLPGCGMQSGSVLPMRLKLWRLDVSQPYFCDSILVPWVRLC